MNPFKGFIEMQSNTPVTSRRKNATESDVGKDDIKIAILGGYVKGGEDCTASERL
jgi:hypothetical protein